jgi:hypothetical protein
MTKSKTYRRPEKVPFNSPDPAKVPAYGPGLWDFWKQVSSENRRWMKQNLDPSATWAVVRAGRIIEEGYQNVFPSIWFVHSLSKEQAPAYLITRPAETYRDRTLYFKEGFGAEIAGVVGEDKDSVVSYSPSEQISMLGVRSGKLRELEDFVLGELKTLVRKGAKHLPQGNTPGATSAIIKPGFLSEKGIAIDSCPQLPKSVWRARGYNVIPRLHVCDDSVADIFATYDDARVGDWPELVLSGPRKN